MKVQHNLQADHVSVGLCCLFVNNVCRVLLQVVIAYGSVYLVFLWCYYGGTGTWVYRALDWTRFMSVPFYLALPLLLMLGFLLM